MATATREPQPAAAPPRPSVPAPLATATGAFWAALSRLRGGRRSLHPIGIGFDARLVVDGRGAKTGVPLFDSAGSHRALVRFSRGAGLPEPLPDVLGLSFRLLDVHGPGRHQDFLLATSLDLPVLRHLLLPGVGFFRQPFSSVLLYAVGGRTAVVGAHHAGRPPADTRGALPALEAAAARGDLRYRLTLAAPAGRPQAVGELRVGERLPAAVSDTLAFNPWNTGGGIRPRGPFMGWRRAAYRGSQLGRGLPPGQIP